LYDMNKLEESIPKLSAQPHLLREARFRLSFNTGWEELKALELDRARDRLRRAVGYKPSSSRAWTALAIAQLPKGVLRVVKQSLKAAHRSLLSTRVCGS
jgi:Tfp pilus assembly protein PilF